MPEDGEGADVIRSRLAPFPVELQRCSSAHSGTRMNDESEEHLRNYRIGPELKRGDNPKVAAATLQRPEQIGVVFAACCAEFAVSSHNIGGDEIVTTQPVFATEPTDAPGQRQTCDSGLGDDTHRYGQPECLRLVVELTNGDATFCPDRLGKRIDSNTLHQG